MIMIYDPLWSICRPYFFIQMERYLNWVAKISFVSDYT